MDHLSDEDLVARSRLEGLPSERRREFIDALFGRYHSRVAIWCLRSAGNRETAADLAQEILLKAYRNLDSFRSDSKFSTWLYSIARNHCVNYQTGQSARMERAAEPLDFDLTDRALGADGQLERESEIRQMKELMLANLDETEIQVMTLHYGEEMPVDAVSRLLSLTNQSGAKAHLVSARRKLKAAVLRLRARQ